MSQYMREVPERVRLLCQNKNNMKLETKNRGRCMKLKLMQRMP